MTHYVAPQVQDLLRQVKEAARPPAWQGTPAQARTNPTLMRLLFGPAPALHRSEGLMIPSPDGGVPARLYLPSPKPRGTIVYLHGGGWVIGSVADWDAFTATLAAQSGCAVVSIDYRLAPEHPYPAALNDALAALDWIAHHAEQALGFKTGRLVVAGDSAGANLATIAVRHHHERPSARRYDLQVLAYPVTDCDFDTPSYLEFAEGKLLTRADMQWFWSLYVPDAEKRSHPDVSPLRAPSLAGVPRSLILTAALDPLRDEGERYAEKLRLSGVAVDLVRCEGLVHGFLSMTHRVPEAGRAFERIVEVVSACTSGGAERNGK